MDVLGFDALQGCVFRHARAGRLREALEVAVRAAREHPEMAAKTAYWMACLHTRLGEAERVIAVLEEAMERGAWWSDAVLMADPDLEAVRKTAEFRAIVSECERRRREAQARAKPELVVLEPGEDEGAHPGADAGAEIRWQAPAPPLMIAIHWRGGSAQRFAEHWRGPARAAGILLALPQSSQVYGQSEFSWDDQDLAESEIASAHAQLTATRRFDPARVILAGASQGGRLAISMTLKGQAIPSRGFIAVVPAIREITALVPLMEGAARRGVKGYILTGEMDQFLTGVRTLHDEMTKAGFPCQLLVKSGLAHEFPGDFPNILAAAIDYVLA